MNQKVAYSVLFCALLASTFAHELRAKGAVPVSSRHHKGLLSRSAALETCTLSCNITATFGHGITVQVINDILVVANYSAHGAVLIDVSAQIVVALNGTSGAGVALNVTKQTGVAFSSGLWVGGSTELTAFITGLGSAGLSSLWSLSGGVSFTVAGITAAQLSIIANVVAVVIVGAAAQVAVSAVLGLQLLLTISGQIITLLSVELSGLLLLIGAKEILIASDLAGLLLVLLTLKAIVLSVAANWAALIALGVVIDIVSILGARNAVIALANIILQFGVVASVGASLAVLLNSSAAILIILRGLGGGSLVGVSGVLTTAATLVELEASKIGLEVAIAKLVLFHVANAVSANFSEEFSVSIAGLLTAVSSVGLNSTLAVVVKVASDIQAGVLIVGRLNISAVIAVLLKVSVATSASLLASVVATVFLLKAVALEWQLALYLILYFFANLSVAYGIGALAVLGFSISTSFSILTVLNGALVAIWSLLTGASIWTVLKGISGLGAIVSAVGAAWQGGGVTFADLLSSGKGLVIAYFQKTASLSLGASSTNLANVSAIAQAATNFSLSSSLSFSVNGSASGSILLG